MTLPVSFSAVTSRYRTSGSTRFRYGDSTMTNPMPGSWRSKRSRRRSPAATSSVTWTAVMSSVIERPKRTDWITSHWTSVTGTTTRRRWIGWPHTRSGATASSVVPRAYSRRTKSMSRTRIGTTMRITQAPSANFATAKMTATTAVASAPTPLITALRRQPGPLPTNQCRTIPACDRVKAVKTPIA